MADPRGCFDAWAEGKCDLQRSSLLEGLIDLADRPLTELPGACVVVTVGPATGVSRAGA